MTRFVSWVSIVGAVATGQLAAGCGGESINVVPCVSSQCAPGEITTGADAGAQSPQLVQSPQLAVPRAMKSGPPMRAGFGIGYELVYNAPGNYRFRWTGDSQVSHPAIGRRFQGWVWTPGHFTSITPGCDDGSCALEAGEDYLSAVERVDGGERIAWNTVVWNGWDGFSFTTDGADIHLELQTDGLERADALDYVVAPSRNPSAAEAVPAVYISPNR